MKFHKRTDINVYVHPFESNLSKWKIGTALSFNKESPIYHDKQDQTYFHFIFAVVDRAVHSRISNLNNCGFKTGKMFTFRMKFGSQIP